MASTDMKSGPPSNFKNNHSQILLARKPDFELITTLVSVLTKFLLALRILQQNVSMNDLIEIDFAMWGWTFDFTNMYKIKYYLHIDYAFMHLSTTELGSVLCHYLERCQGPQVFDKCSWPSSFFINSFENKNKWIFFNPFISLKNDFI